jgi:hypothetical protein
MRTNEIIATPTDKYGGFAVMSKATAIIVRKEILESNLYQEVNVVEACDRRLREQHSLLAKKSGGTRTSTPALQCNSEIYEYPGSYSDTDTSVNM